MLSFWRILEGFVFSLLSPYCGSLLLVDFLGCLLLLLFPSCFFFVGLSVVVYCSCCIVFLPNTIFLFPNWGISQDQVDQSCPGSKVAYRNLSRFKGCL